MGYKNENWNPNYTKLSSGKKRKNITLYCCQICGGTGKQTEDTPDGEWWETQEYPCGFCGGTGKKKRTESVFEKDYYKLMESDRESCGMKFRKPKK